MVSMLSKLFGSGRKGRHHTRPAVRGPGASRLSRCRPQLEALEDRALLSVVGVGGFYTPDDGYRHAIVGLTDGTVHEVYYSPAVGIFDATLENF